MKTFKINPTDGFVDVFNENNEFVTHFSPRECADLKNLLDTIQHRHDVINVLPDVIQEELGSLNAQMSDSSVVQSVIDSVLKDTETITAVVENYEQELDCDTSWFSKCKESVRSLVDFNNYVGKALFEKDGKDLYINNWRVHVLEKGDSYGLDNCLIYEKDEPCVEFFDMSVNKEVFPNGQFTGGRYYLSSMIETEGSDLSLMDRAVYGIGLSLDFDIPVWTVAPEDLRVIAAWLQAFSDNLDSHKGLNLASKLADATERSEKTDTGVAGKDDIVKGFE